MKNANVINAATEISVSEGTVSNYFALFRGRTDKIGLSTKLSTSINEQDLLQYVQNHLAGVTRLGFYNLLPDGTSPWAMIECEDHGSFTLPNPRQTSLDILAHFRSCGISAYRELSKNPNGNCYHVWIFFGNPVSAEKLHISLNSFVTHVFGRNGMPFNVSYVSHRFKHYVRIAGMAETIHLHSTRHSFASNLAEKNVDLFVIGKLLGHSSPALTTTLYAHVSTSHLHDVVNLLQ